MLKRVAAVSLVLMLLAGCASGGKGHASQPSREPDWIQLTSGEWLKGRIKSMQQRRLDFDSEKLKDLSLDWEDVKAIYSPSATCRFGDRDIYTGALKVDPKFVSIDSEGGGEVRLPRSELNAISPGGMSERNYWSGTFAMGATVRTGNSNSTDLTAQANVQRRTPDSKLALAYLGNYNTASGAKTADNQRVDAAFDRNLARDLFVRPIGGQYYRDPLANIQNQATVSGGAGYYILNQPKVEWEFFTGPAFQYTKFVNTEVGHSGENFTPAGLFQTHFDKELTPRLDLVIDWQGVLTGRDAGLFTQHAVGTLRFKITRVLDLDLSLIWDRTEQPQANSSGHVPKRDDFQSVLSVGVRF